MRALFLIAAAGILTFVAALLGPAALAGEKPKMGDVSRADLRGVNFIENCRFSHRAPDDPIVFPGRAGASHDHTFVGNRSTNASSSFGSLRSSDTTCMRPADTAAYWVPTLYQGANAVLPDGATIYYRRGTLSEVRTFPNNLRMIAGDATATTRAERARDVLELRRRHGNRADEHRPHLPRCPRLVPPAARALPELLGRPPPRQRRSQEPYGLRDGQALPLHASGLGAGDHADLPLSDPGR